MLFNILILVGIIIIFALWPKTKVSFGTSFEANHIGEDIEEYLRLNEGKDKYLHPWAKKTIIWHDKKKTKKTAVSVVYIHGFSASLGEIRPVPDLIANNLGANLYFARLSGHGSRDPLALGKCNSSDWYRDIEESLEIGLRIGNQVLVIATSFGAALVSEYLSKNNLDNRMVGTVFISPCYGIPNWRVHLFRYPFWSKFLYPTIFGKLRVSTSQTAEESKWWSQVYPVVAIENLVLCVEKIWRSNFRSIKSPNLMIFCNEDRLVSIPRIKTMQKRWGGGASLKPLDVPLQTDHNNYHVIMGDIKSPTQTEKGVQLILDWLDLNLKLPKNFDNKKHNNSKSRKK
mgnify:FL=1